MIIDNHKGVRMGVITYLESHADFELVAEASNGAEAITRYIKEKPEIFNRLTELYEAWKSNQRRR